MTNPHLILPSNRRHAHARYRDGYRAKQKLSIRTFNIGQSEKRIIFWVSTYTQVDSQENPTFVLQLLCLSSNTRLKRT